MITPVVKRLIHQLNKADLSLEDRVALTTCMLSKLNVLPIGDTVHITEGRLIINGKELDQEQMLAFRESSIALKDNYARRVINEQIRYKAVNLGINVALSLDTIMFAKAAIWCVNEEEILINTLANQL